MHLKPTDLAKMRPEGETWTFPRTWLACGRGLPAGEANFAAIQAWNAASVYQHAIAIYRSANRWPLAASISRSAAMRLDFIASTRGKPQKRAH
jgi:hypothetical protein